MPHTRPPLYPVSETWIGSSFPVALEWVTTSPAEGSPLYSVAVNPGSISESVIVRVHDPPVVITLYHTRSLVNPVEADTSSMKFQVLPRLSLRVGFWEPIPVPFQDRATITVFPAVMLESIVPDWPT